MAVPYHTHTFEIPSATNAEIEAGVRDDVVATPANLGSAAAKNIDYFATSSQGSSADTAVQTVNGKSGKDISITKGDVGLGDVDNTSDAAKPISSATQAALDSKANANALGSAAYKDENSFATATQGAKADTAVQPSRSISAGTGLTGGGDLSANRSIALNAASVSSLAKADTAVQPARTISAGTGLSGGGDLSADRTLALSTGTQSSLAKADTAMQAPGGSAGQVLTKNSATDNDVSWQSVAAATAVSYAPQTLTPAQQGQAIANIGASVLAGFHNKIINGCAEMVQRGTAFNIPAGQAVYTADRWRIFNNTNQTLNVQCPVTVPFTGSGKHPRLRLAFATAPTTGNVFVSQHIEGADTLAGRKATMSFAHAGEAMNATCYLSQNFGSGGSAGVLVPPGNQIVPIQSDGGIGIAKLAFDIPSTENKIFGTGDFLEWVVSLPMRTTAPVTMTRMSLVEGDATAEDDPFSPRHIQQELALCQRYYELVVGGYSGDTVSGSAYRGYIWPAVAKRATPTILWHSAQAVFRFPGSVTLVGLTPLGAAAIEAVSGSTGSGSYFYHAIAFDAEL